MGKHHVVPQERGWAVKGEGKARASAVFATQDEAIAAAKRPAARPAPRKPATKKPSATESSAKGKSLAGMLKGRSRAMRKLVAMR